MNGQHVPLTAQETRGAKELAKAPEKLTTATSLANSVPVFTPLERGDLLLEYTERGGKLIFHVYHKVRKQLWDAALAEAEQKSDNPRHLQMLEDRLSGELEKHPWWLGTGDKLYEMFTDFFREKVKVVFDPEVDSWSVTVHVPELPTAWTDQTRGIFLNRLHACL